MRLLEQAERDGVDLALSAATIIEVSHSGVDIARLSWLLSRIRVEAVTKECARRSAALVKAAGLHGHRYAIGAMVAEVALRLPAPVAVAQVGRAGGRTLPVVVHLPVGAGLPGREHEQGNAGGVRPTAE